MNAAVSPQFARSLCLLWVEPRHCKSGWKAATRGTEAARSEREKRAVAAGNACNMVCSRGGGVMIMSAARRPASSSDFRAQGRRRNDFLQIRSDCVGVDGVRGQPSPRARAGKSLNSGANPGSKYLPGQHGPAATVRPAGPAISQRNNSSNRAINSRCSPTRADSSREVALPDPYTVCLNQLAVSRQFAPLAGKITVGTVDPKAIELFGISSRPTATEKTLITRWAEWKSRCQAIGVANFRKPTPAEWFAYNRWGLPATLSLVHQLVAGQLTYGQFNYRRAMNEVARQRYMAANR